MKSYLRDVIGGKSMRVVLAGATLGLAAAAVININKAQAEPTTNCKSVSVDLVDRNDNGSHGLWAKDTMTRTVKVCRGDEALVEGKATYYATVTDKGTFVTVEGKSPRAGVDLAAGIEGTVNGGFTIKKFTALPWEKGFKLTAPTPTTSSPDWVAVAFPGSNAEINTYKWVYKTTCEKYTDDNGNYDGDITKECPVTESPSPSPSVSVSPSASASASATPSRSVSTSAAAPVPSRSTSAAGASLPVTGAPAKLGLAVGAALVLVGGAAIALGRRRRTKFEAS